MHRQNFMSAPEVETHCAIEEDRTQIADASSERGALRLERKIAEYWRKKTGGRARVRLEIKAAHIPGEERDVYAVRSDMVDGQPREAGT